MVYLNEYSLTLRTGVVNPPDLVPAVRKLRDVTISMFEDSEGLVGCTTGGPPETCHTEVDVTILDGPPTRPSGVSAICVIQFRHTDGPPVMLDKTKLMLLFKRHSDSLDANWVNPRITKKSI